MPIKIPSSLVELILLGPRDDRRQLQDSPILGDVWVEFGARPSERVDLLIEPYRGQHAGEVAALINTQLEDTAALTNIACLQGLIVADLTFPEVLRVVVPKTKWWISRWIQDDEPTNEHEVMRHVKSDGALIELLQQVVDSAIAWKTKAGAKQLQELSAIKRFLALAALILWAGGAKSSAGPQAPGDPIESILKQARKNLKKIVPSLESLIHTMLKDSTPEPKDSTPEPLVWQVSRNRDAMPAISKSIPAVKADAATTLFKVNCSDIGWAVIDSGIDGNHPAFLDREGKKGRVKRAFDFRNFRRIVSLGNMNPDIRKDNVEFLLRDPKILKKPPSSAEKADTDLLTLALDAQNRGPVHWELVERFVEIDPSTEPPAYHGTHVAGILGASREAAEAAAAKAAAEREARKAAERAAGSDLEKSAPEAVRNAVRKGNPDLADGMCPDITLYDFRVLGSEVKDTEFAIIAALQFIRYLNDRDNFLTIHGANLSLSIPHDVRNFACGRTPVCDECERLVASGVVVVAAAGNHGYKSFETKEGLYDSYAAFSITDPGNADSVITVGATHRFWPHTYGVSFFSSRGPTGDGRMKPDLVAPGERIRAPLPGDHPRGGAWGDLDGTSMAAPHVSGAAAMLMARYSELVGQPLRLKRIICQSATDLGRERSFQGHGMLDVLRAFQSI